MDTDSFVLIINTSGNIKDLLTLNLMFDLSNLNKNHEIFADRNNKLIERCKKNS